MIKHSGKGIKEINAHLMVNVNGDDIFITMNNDVNRKIDITLLKSNIEELSKLIRTKSALEKTSKEGGTGIIKIQKILQYDLGSEAYTITPMIEDDFQFNIEINANIRGVLS